MFYLNKELEIIQVDKGDGTCFYDAQLEQGNAYYYISSDIELTEFEKILNGIYFESV